MKDDIEEFLARVVEECPKCIYVLLTNSIITPSCSYSDLRKPIVKPYFDFIKPLYCRLMGVLFWHQEKRDFSKTFQFKFDHNQPFKPVELYAIYPPGE